jgi:hypothetical protein
LCPAISTSSEHWRMKLKETTFDVPTQKV